MKKLFKHTIVKVLTVFVGLFFIIELFYYGLWPFSHSEKLTSAAEIESLEKIFEGVDINAIDDVRAYKLILSKTWKIRASYNSDQVPATIIATHYLLPGQSEMGPALVLNDMAPRLWWPSTFDETYEWYSRSTNYSVFSLWYSPADKMLYILYSFNT